MINTALAHEIYRGLWVVESTAINPLKNTLKDARAGVINDTTERLNSFCYGKLDMSATISVEESKNTSKTEQKISVTNINGVITKAGGASSRGMKELSIDLYNAENDPSVVGHLFVIDSPGGSVSGMNFMKNTMKSLKKPKVTIVERQGMAASGGYGIASEGDYVMAESEDAEVGSVGVIAGAQGVPNGEKDGNGEVHFMVYATKSTEKNAAEELAINSGDVSLLKERADKLNEEFHTSTKAAMPNIKDSQMTGAMYPAREVVGTMIDAIGSKKDAANKILELSKSNPKFNAKSKNNSNISAMTQTEIKAQFPEAYSAIRGEGYSEGLAKGVTDGVAKEQERVKCWQVFASVDPEAVSKGIAEGREIKQSEVLELQLKASNTGKLQSLQGQSAPPVVVPPAAAERTAELTADQQEAAAIYGALLGDKIKLN